MRFNTLVGYPMTAEYRGWVPMVVQADGLTYRRYGSSSVVKCNIIVSITGTVSLLSDERLQPFGVISEMKDAKGTPVMDETWYSIQKVTPVYDAFGYVSSYRHQLAILAPELLGQPINPPKQYPDLDQQS